MANELHECLKYFSARGVYDRGPSKLVGAGPPKIARLTWSEWFRLKWGDDFDDYVARAKREGLGAQAVEFAERLGRG